MPAPRPDRKGKDSYEVRRREGRPTHGTTSVGILVLGSIAWIMQAAAIGMPRWRSVGFGTLGYTRPRHWGLFVVSGKRVQSHNALLQDVCVYSGGLHVGGICLSPICQWYKVKCHVYRNIRDLGYVVGAVFIVELAIHTLCMFWTVKLQPDTIMNAFYCWLIVVLIHIGAIITYALMSGDPFDELQQHAFYPEPSLGLSFISSILALVLLVMNAMLGRSLAAMWPDPDGEEASTEDSEDEGDNEFLKAGTKKKQQGGPPGQPPAQPLQQGTQPGQPMQQAFSAPMGSGMGPQAFDNQPAWQTQQFGTRVPQEQWPPAGTQYGPA